MALGGGGAACAPLSPSVRPGGPVGWGVASPQPLPLPPLGRQQSGCPWRRSGHGGPGPHTAPVRVRLLSLGAVRVAPFCASAGLLAHRGSCESRRLGRGGGPCSSLPPGRRGPAGGRGDHLPASGGWGVVAPVACGWGDRGGLRSGSPAPPSGGGGMRLSALSPLSSPVHPPQAYAFGRGRGVAPGAGCGPLPAGQPGGGGRGGLAHEPPPRRAGRGAGGPGGRSASAHPSAFPGRAKMRASSATLRSWGARPPYCSGSSSRAAPGRALCVALLRWCGFARLSRPPREQPAGGAGAGGVRVQLCPPPASRFLLGERGHPLCLGGGGGPAPPRPAGRGGSGGGEGGGGRRRPLPPCAGGVVHGPRPCPLGHPPWVYTFSRGCRAAMGAGCGLVRRRRVSVAGGGVGEVSLPRSAPPPCLPRAGTEAGRFVFSLLGAAVPPRPMALAQSRRSAAGNAEVSGRPTGGAWRAAALAAAVASPPWVPRASRGGAGPPPLRPASGRLQAGGGGRGGGRGGGEGGFPSVPPWFPGTTPRLPRGGGPAVPVPGDQPPTGGAHPSPAPLRPQGARPPCRSSLRPPALLAVAARGRPARGGGGEGW